MPIGDNVAMLAEHSRFKPAPSLMVACCSACSDALRTLHPDLDEEGFATMAKADERTTELNAIHPVNLARN